MRSQSKIQRPARLLRSVMIHTTGARRNSIDARLGRFCRYEPTRFDIPTLPITHYRASIMARRHAEVGHHQSADDEPSASSFQSCARSALPVSSTSFGCGPHAWSYSRLMAYGSRTSARYPARASPLVDGLDVCSCILSLRAAQVSPSEHRYWLHRDHGDTWHAVHRRPWR